MHIYCYYDSPNCPGTLFTTILINTNENTEVLTLNTLLLNIVIVIAEGSLSLQPFPPISAYSAVRVKIYAYVKIVSRDDLITALINQLTIC